MSAEIPELVETAPIDVIKPDLYRKLLADEVLDRIIIRGED